MDKTQKMQVANTILHQLGGKRFIAMTGAHNFLATEKGLRMKIRQNKSKANYLYIDLDQGSDTYEMKFVSLRGTSMKTKAEFSDLYADQLQRFFTDVTGYYTSL